MMSRVLYFDCFSGISGDMVLGALLDAGLPLEDLRRALGSLAVSGFEIGARRVLRSGVSATQFVVHEHEHGHLDEDAPEHIGPSHAHVHEHGHVHEHSHTYEPEHHHGRENEPPLGTPHGTPHGTQHPARGTALSTQHAAPGTPVEVPHAHRRLSEICAMIDRSALSAAGRERAKLLFQRLAEVEAAIHQMSVEDVHLHEVGALDSIIDIVGAVFALEWFGAERIAASAVNVGGGMIDTAHGWFPVPAPATLQLLGNVPIYGGPVQQELVTPTGALILSSYAGTFGPILPMTVERSGYGAGARDIPGTPNVLRVLVGRAAAGDKVEARQVSVIECEIDDMNPQIFGVVMEQLYAAGALEVFYVPVQMKKNRPGTLLTVIAAPERRSVLSEIIFRETTTIGLRHSEVDRECLQREVVSVETPIGAVRFKIAWRNGHIVNAVPEFDDCARLASARNLSVKAVQSLALQAYSGRPLPGDPRS